MEISVGPLTSELRELSGRGGGRIVRGRGIEDTWRTWPTESTKRTSMALTETEVAIMGPAWVCTKPSANMLLLLAWCFCDTPDSGSEGVSGSFAYLWAPFPPTGLPCLTLI